MLHILCPDDLQILHLSVKNHESYLKRRQPDPMDIQQMKTQADEERKRKFGDRKRLQEEMEARMLAEEDKERLMEELVACKESLRVAHEKLVSITEARVNYLVLGVCINTTTEQEVLRG